MPFIMAANVNHKVFLRSLGLPALVIGVLLLWVVGSQVALSWQALQRLVPVERHMAHMTRLQKINVRLQRELVGALAGAHDSATVLVQLRHDIRGILDLDAHLSADTPRLLRQARETLADPALTPRDALVGALSFTRDALDQEAIAHEALVGSVRRAARLELQVGLIALVVFPLLALGLLFLLRKRIFTPLRQLSELMTLISRRDYAPAPTRDVDPLLLPLTESYNHMADRLSLLEVERQQREHDLETQVRQAAHTLLAQSRVLSQADRMAAVGESMARVAHELRNPLAGVKLACANLDADLGDAELKSRMTLIMGELDRVIAVLNALLDQARHQPEAPRPVDVAGSVQQLRQLLRYQLPPGIQLHQDIPDDLVCDLPEALFQQALLNLVLNAAQALTESRGEITVAACRESASLVLTVTDDGPGFCPDMLTLGVRPFATQRVGGTGLGLSMVQRFARTLGGELKLANTAPHGAMVTLELPCPHA
ncbi:MAG: two-component sensor histidine kinase [Thiobacillus sp.]|nr:two-component sensor histidine kinase [Thiobacillus sp.]